MRQVPLGVILVALSVVVAATLAAARSTVTTTVVVVAAMLVAGAAVRVEVLARRAIDSWPHTVVRVPSADVLPAAARPHRGSPAEEAARTLDGDVGRSDVVLRADGRPVARLVVVRAARFPDAPAWLRVHLEAGTEDDSLPADLLTDAALVERARRWRSRPTDGTTRYALSWWLPSGPATLVVRGRGRVLAHVGDTWCVAWLVAPGRRRSAEAEKERGLPGNHLAAQSGSAPARAAARRRGALCGLEVFRWLTRFAEPTDGLALLPLHVALAVLGVWVSREVDGRAPGLVVVAAGFLLGLTGDARARARLRRGHLEIRDRWRVLRVPWSSVTSVTAVGEAVVVRFDDGAPDALVLEQPAGEPGRLLRNETDPERAASLLTDAWLSGRSEPPPRRRSHLSAIVLLGVLWAVVLVTTFLAGPV